MAQRPRAEHGTAEVLQPPPFAEFSKRYLTELRGKEQGAAVSELVDLNRRRAVTLITASRDLEHSEVAVLATHLRRLVARRLSAPGAA